MYGLKSKDGEYVGPARKGTGFMTNSICVAQKLNKRCPNRQGHQVHRHVILSNGRAKAAQVYPAGLCRAICEGLQEQIKMDEKGQFLLMIASDAKNTTSKQARRQAGRQARK